MYSENNIIDDWLKITKYNFLNDTGNENLFRSKKYFMSLPTRRSDRWTEIQYLKC